MLNEHLNPEEHRLLRESIKAADLHWKTLRQMMITGKINEDALVDVVQGMEITLNKLEYLQEGQV